MNKNILIVSYYWPPAGGPGVQRWLKFTKYLPDFGYVPTVYIPQNPSYPIIDTSLFSEINSKVNIIKQPIWEPYALAEKLTKKNKEFKAGQFETEKKSSILSKLSVFIRGNFFIPDARKFWINPSVKYLNQYIIENKIKVLITTGPPHSMHLIGLKLKKLNNNLKWIADFRDPWTQISYYSQLRLTSLADKKHKQLEKEVMQTADVVLSTSYIDKKNFENIGAKKVVCITNGFDSEVVKTIKKTKKFTLSYIGMLETLRNPKNLWNILDELVVENSEFKNSFELKFTGKISASILDDLRKLSFKKNIINKGYLSHKDSVLEMNNSDLLLLTNFPEDKSRGIIPGKLFEYLATGRKIISIGPDKADVEFILKETNAGKHFSYNDLESLKDFILQEFENWKNNITALPSADINNFSRKELTKKLSGVIDDLMQ